MTIELATIISIVSLGLAFVMGISTLRRNNRLDDRHESTQFARLEVQLEHIARNVNVIVQDMNDIKDEIKEHRDRILRTEESTKQAHKRIDEIAGRK